MFRFLFHSTGKLRETNTPDKARCFTYHRKSGSKALLIALLMAGVAETTVLHYFLHRWNPWIAWIATLSSLWLVLKIVAQIRAVRCQPIFIFQDRIHIRNGMFSLASFPLTSIERVVIGAATPPPADNGPLPLNCCFPAAHNTTLYLNREQEATLLLGKRRSFNVALLYLDDPQEFVEAIQLASVPEE